MPRISEQKIEKISEQILSYLYSIFPKQIFTSDIAKELARDEEFMKNLLKELEKKELVVKIDKNSLGYKYSRRLRWRISNKAYEIYKKLQ
jgi:predicted transcriptional regulator with HTH domain